MSLEHMLRDKQEAMNFLLGEEFGMDTEFYRGLFTTMQRTGMETQTEQEKLEEAWHDLQAVPSYVERYTDVEAAYPEQEMDELVELWHDLY